MNTTETLINSNGETYYKMQREDGVFIYSFSEDFEDYWTNSEQDIYGE